MPTTPRRSRADQRAANREALLAAAARLIKERGFRVSVEEIARAAGLTKGAVYSNFDGRADLVVQASERLRPMAPHRIELRGSLAESLGRAGADLAASVQRESEALRLSLELMAEALRDPDLHQRLLAVPSEPGEQGPADFQARADAAGWTLPVPAEQLAITLNALAGGLALHRLYYGPEVVPDGLFAWACSCLAGAGNTGQTGTGTRRTDVH